MRESVFRFKKFSLHHNLCPMPISTDGVLLGAWVDVCDTKNVLDIGTGCGLIALMIAQRNQDAEIDAIDIHPGAIQQATQNFNESPWSNRLNCDLTDFLEYAVLTNKTFDLIVSNPPFYTEDTKSPDVARANAHNASSLPLNHLIDAAAKMLNPYGRLCLITPASIKDDIEEAALKAGLYVHRTTFVNPTPDLTPHRILWQLGNEKRDKDIDELTIEISRHVYTQDYINLTKDFYLKM